MSIRTKEQFLKQNIRKIPLASLQQSHSPDQNGTDCPICSVDYESHLPNHPYERAVQITGIESCSHVLGEVCLRKWINSGEFMSHTCPFCRTEWFESEFQEKEEGEDGDGGVGEEGWFTGWDEETIVYEAVRPETEEERRRARVEMQIALVICFVILAGLGMYRACVSRPDVGGDI